MSDMDRIAPFRHLLTQNKIGHTEAKYAITELFIEVDALRAQVIHLRAANDEYATYVRMERARDRAAASPHGG